MYVFAVTILNLVFFIFHFLQTYTLGCEPAILAILDKEFSFLNDLSAVYIMNR